MMRHASWTVALVLAGVLAASATSPGGAGPGAGPSEPAAVIAPAETVRMLQATLGQAVQRFEAQDASGVLAHVSDRYRTGPLTKAAVREQLIAIYSLYDAVSARIRIDEVQMVGEHAWVYSTGEVSGRLRFLGTWIVFLSWQHELEVARQEGGGWRLFGYQQ
jgi:hypothetical protein